jgi:predicted DNA-binding transcriptional regulator AlpA
MAQDGHVNPHREVQFDLRRLRHFVSAVGEPCNEVLTMTAAVRPSDDEWLSLAQFARVVGKAPGTIYNEIAQGADLPPYYKFRQYIRFRKSDVDHFLEKHRRVTASAQLAEGPKPKPVTSARPGQSQRPWESHRNA